MNLDTIASECMPPLPGQRTDGRKSMGSPLWKSAFYLAVALTFCLWPWKPFQQLPLTWRIFMTSIVEIPPLSTEISRHVK